MKKDPALVYNFQELADCLNQGIPFIPIHAGTPNSRIEEIKQLSFLPHAEELAYIIMTSGSTGTPKAVQITKSNLSFFISFLHLKDLVPASSEVAANGFSFGFDGSLIFFLACRESGAKFYNLDTNLNSDGPLLPETGIWSSTPSSLSQLMLYKNFDEHHYPRLKRFYFGGEALLAQTVVALKKRFPNAEVWNMYGPTEGTIMASVQKIETSMLEQYSSLPIASLKNLGELKLVPVKSEPLYEIYIQGAGVSPGYLNYNSDSFCILADGAPAYRTGDLCKVVDDLVFFHSREDEQIKLHGHRIELSEIESIVRRSNLVQNCLCAALERESKVQRIVCFVQLQANRNGSVQELKKMLSDSLPSYMFPHDIISVSDWPLTANLKSDKEALIKKYFAASFKI